MRRGGPQHPKVTLLAATLNIPQYAAVGLLECLWHWVDAYAPRGDIGRFPAAAIAAGVGWGGDANALIDALLGCHFLDQHPTAGLVVHDWNHHADQYTRRRLTRCGEWFVTERKPVGKMVSNAADRRLASSVIGKRTRPPSRALRQNLQKSSSTALLHQAATETSSSRAALAAAFMTFWKRYPPRRGRREGKAEAEREYLKLAPDAALQATLLAAVQAYGDSTELPKDACRWLRGRNWEDEIGVRAERVPRQIHATVPPEIALLPAEKPDRSPEAIAEVRKIVGSLPWAK